MLRIINIFIALQLLTSVFGQSKVNYREIEKQILDQLLDPTKYDPRIRPPGANGNDSTSTTDGPVVVHTNIYIRSIEYVCTKKQEYKLQMTYRNQWNDQRLKFDDRGGKIKYISLEDTEKIWNPDTFISNSRSTVQHKDIKPNLLFRVYPNGNILFSTRLTTILACPMILKHYPFDKQICSIQLASYGYTTEDLVYLFKEGDPVQITKNLHMQHFILEQYGTGYCTSRTNTGEYSCMKVDFRFARVTKHLFDWFLPTALLTLVSFVSFWLKPTKSSRIKLLIATLILQYLHILYINNVSPVPTEFQRTSLYCWTSTCLGFILAVFVEYAIVRGIDKLNKRNKRSIDTNEGQNGKTVNNCEEGDAVALKPLVDEGQENHLTDNGKQYTVNVVPNRRNYVQKWSQSSAATRVDYLSAIIFPLLFIVYIIIFICLNTTNEDNGTNATKYIFNATDYKFN